MYYQVPKHAETRLRQEVTVQSLGEICKGALRKRCGNVEDTSLHNADQLDIEEMW